TEQHPPVNHQSGSAKHQLKHRFGCKASGYCHELAFHLCVMGRDWRNVSMVPEERNLLRFLPSTDGSTATRGSPAAFHHCTL
ncbi:hypothetical protein HAX54_006346, partial [Datura stramonium]|nr:hypothetical protein [Datura stramonium]